MSCAVWVLPDSPRRPAKMRVAEHRSNCARATYHHVGAAKGCLSGAGSVGTDNSAAARRLQRSLVWISSTSTAMLDSQLSSRELRLRDFRGRRPSVSLTLQGKRYGQYPEIPEATSRADAETVPGDAN